jgi:hypothetical protein
MRSFLFWILVLLLVRIVMREPEPDQRNQERAASTQ